MTVRAIPNHRLFCLLAMTPLLAAQAVAEPIDTVSVLVAQPESLVGPFLAPPLNLHPRIGRRWFMAASVLQANQRIEQRIALDRSLRRLGLSQRREVTERSTRLANVIRSRNLTLKAGEAPEAWLKVADLSNMIASRGDTPVRSDANGDGCVNAIDFGIFPDAFASGLARRDSQDRSPFGASPSLALRGGGGNEGVRWGALSMGLVFSAAGALLITTLAFVATLGTHKDSAQTVWQTLWTRASGRASP